MLTIISGRIVYIGKINSNIPGPILKFKSFFATMKIKGYFDNWHEQSKHEVGIFLLDSK